MTKDQYLKQRIADLESILESRHLPTKYRQNQQLALLTYRMDLERSAAQTNGFSGEP